MNIALVSGLIILILLVIMLIAGVPIAVALGISSVVAILPIMDLEVAVVTGAQRIFSGISMFSTKMIRKKLPIPVISTEETLTGNWLKTVMIRLLYRANSSLRLISWNIYVPVTAYLTAMYRFIPSTHGIIQFLLLYVKMMKRNLSESTTSAKTIK